MRAHGIGDESGLIDDNDDAQANKRMYALRANPNRLESFSVCENCGESFNLENGKCSYEDAESLVSSPGLDGQDGTPRPRGCGNWSKRKRTLRAEVGNFNSNCPYSEEEDLANCLMMLSNATVDHLYAEPEEYCASASKEEERRIRNTMNLIACRVPIMGKAKGVANEDVFECKACKKVFNSHQALGGHRASHKKVKGCFAADEDHDVIAHEEFFPTKSTSTMQFNTSLAAASSSKRKSKVHECSICHRVFSSGQALGGHKRCHWIASNSPADPSSLAKFQQFHCDDHVEQFQQRPKFIDNSDPLDLKLNLNLPAPDGDYARGRREHVSMEADNKRNNCNTSSIQNDNVDDRADSKVKLAKLSELKDMNTSGGSSPWLQVGIGSTSDVEADP